MELTKNPMNRKNESDQTAWENRAIYKSLKIICIVYVIYNGRGFLKNHQNEILLYM